jgi:excinuclease ABC subunit C
MGSGIFERHSSDVWRKTASALVESEAGGGAADQGRAKEINANGAPLLGDSRDTFRPKASDIPAQPGVYKWRDAESRVIYVGKAKNLRNRLSNYFQPLYQLHPRTQTMVLTARSLEWTVVGTELEALTLEYTWIKEFDPRFNVVFRDDKTYPYLAISVGEDVPRIWITRSRKRRDTRYFGPYAKVWDVRQTLDTLLKSFPVRTCSPGVFRRAQLSNRPCLLASIGKCSAPCVQRIDLKEHRKMCEQLIGVMTGRLGRSFQANLTAEMKAASSRLDFELAARLRDQIAMLNTVIEQNAVVFDSDVDADVFGLASDELEASVHAFFVRAGSIRGERSWSVERVEDVSDEELVGDLITQVYSTLVEEVNGERNLGNTMPDADDAHTSRAQQSHDMPSEESASDLLSEGRHSSGISISTEREAFGATQQATATDSLARSKATKSRRAHKHTTGRDDLLEPIAPIPREVILPIEPNKAGQLEDWLSKQRGAAVNIRVPLRGEKRALMDRATANAKQSLLRSKMSRISDMGARTKAMNDLAAALGLDKAPLRIECYDISNTIAGAFQVASMVVFEDAVAKKSEYRRFSIKGRNGEGAVDDTTAIYETLSRRFSHGNVAGDSGDSIDNERQVRQAGLDAGELSSDDGIVQQQVQAHRFAYKPNLVVVDGGKPQVAAAARAMADQGVTDVAVCGLAKRLEEVWLPDEDYPLILKRQSESMYLLQRVRDESHRFAITYHRQKRRKGALRSALDGIPGVGEAFQKKLLNHFGSVRAMREASVEDLQAVNGIGENKAKAIFDALHADDHD